MKFASRYIAIFCIFSLGVAPLLAQAGDGKPERTPEQMAAKQTEALQRELDLTSEQVEQIYEINLRYAQERRETDTRTEVMERMRRKNEDYKRVLTPAQYEHLQSKRVERRTRSAVAAAQSAAENPLPQTPDNPSAADAQQPDGAPIGPMAAPEQATGRAGAEKSIRINNTDTGSDTQP